MTNWIKFDGTECPVGGSVSIDIRCRDGFEISHSRADYPHWTPTGGKSDIVAYRVAK